MVAKPCRRCCIINRVHMVPKSGIDHPPVYVCLPILRIDLNGLVVICYCLGVVAEPMISDTAVMMDGAVTIGYFQSVIIQGYAVSPVPDLSPSEEEQA